MSGLTFDGSGLFGTGLFPAGFDLSTWGPWEYAAVLAGAWVVGSALFTTSRAAKYAAGTPGRLRKRRAASLRKRAAALTAKKGLFS